MSRGVLAVVSGFSGAGKGTIMKKPDGEVRQLRIVCICHHQKPRPGEEDGREYFFRTKEEFEK